MSACLQHAKPYEYMVQTWGGFYNDEHKAVHKLEPGYYWFSTEEARADFINERTRISVELNAHVFVTVLYEGRHTRMRTVARMDLVLDGKTYPLAYDFGYAFEEDAAEYIFNEGNYSCDCNLRSFIRKRHPEVPASDACGETIDIQNFRIQLLPGATGDYAPETEHEAMDPDT